MKNLSLPDALPDMGRGDEGDSALDVLTSALCLHPYASPKTRLTRLGQCCIIACGLSEGHFKKSYYSAQDLKNVAQSQSSARRRSSVAEQLFCKQPVVSSTLTVGSLGSCRSGQSELAVNQSGFALRRFESFTAHRKLSAETLEIRTDLNTRDQRAHVAQLAERVLGKNEVRRFETARGLQVQSSFH